MPDQQTHLRPKQDTLGLAVISAALLLLEVSSTRLLSFISWHHFAFMVVSIAMLGLGAAGVGLATSKKLARVSLKSLCVSGSLLFALAALLGYFVMVWARFSPPLFPIDPIGQLIRLTLTYLALLLPFLAAGIVVVACLTRHARNAPLLYGGDLIGASIGCLAAIVLAGPLTSEQCIFASAVLGGFGAIIFSWPTKKHLFIAFGATCILTMGFLFGPGFYPSKPALGKALHMYMEELRPPGALLGSQNTPLGRIDVVQADYSVGWSLNPNVPDKVPPPSLHLLIDGEADTPVALINDKRPEDLEYLDTLPSSFVFALRRPEKALILGAGGGQDVLSAIRHKTGHIDAVEINPAIVSIMRNQLFEASGKIYGRDDVTLIRSEGRSFVRKAHKNYDVIQMGLVDTWAATNAGGLSLTENFLYTVDAFEDYLDALRPGGMVGITRWHRPEPRETLRLTVLAAKALEKSGSSRPGEHIAVVGAGIVAALIVARDPLTEEQHAKISQLAKERHLDVIWTSKRYSKEKRGEVFHKLFSSPSIEDFTENYRFDVSPVTDDRPFFFDFNSARESWRFLDFLNPHRVSMSGWATLTVVFVQTLFFSIFFLFLPLVSRRISIKRSGFPLVGYFALTGLGFMFVEISLLQRLTLILGHPTHAVAFVLGLLLCSSGVSSLLSPKILHDQQKRMKIALAFLVALAAFQSAFGTELGQILLLVPGGWRLVLASLLVIPIGALMGLPTPFGLRIASGSREDLLPLLWATSSFASVLASVLSVLVAMNHGFSGSLAVGSICYLLAILLVPRSETADS